MGSSREGEDIKEVRRGERIVGRNRDDEGGCGGTSELVEKLMLNDEGEEEEENDDDKDGGEPEEEEALEPNSSSSYSLLLFSLLLCSRRSPPPTSVLILSFAQSLLSNRNSSKSLLDPDPDREPLRPRLLSLLHCLRGLPILGVGNVLGTVSS